MSDVITKDQIDAIYKDRNLLVCALSKCFQAHLGRHPENDPWDEDWRWIVFIELPSGQVSWHIHDSELDNFGHLQLGDNTWDGHTNEEKYQRLINLDPVYSNH